MDKVIIWTNERGFTSVCYPTGELPIEEVLKKDCPAGAVIFDKANLPPDEDFFDAWRIQEDGTVAVHMPAAKEIHRDRMRAARAPKLAALDVEVQRSMEEEQPLAALIARKNALRAVTSDVAIDLATTPAELRAIWPDILK